MPSLVRDVDIRRALHVQLRHDHDLDDTLIIDELGVCQGTRRVDVAVVNGELAGYEIKSPRDTLVRLPDQRDSYSKVFDRVTLVVAEQHCDDATSLVPEWWGVTSVSANSEGRIELSVLRQPARNTDVAPYSLAQLLWREEALVLLEDLELATPSLRRGSRRLMWKCLADQMDRDDLALAVREALKGRQGWRGRERQRG